jgi:glycosyltransferase involved in cell wall biosynthesis
LLIRRTLGRGRRAAQAAGRYLDNRRRHREIARSEPARGSIAVFFGHDRIPSLEQPAHGGTVKFQQLQTVFPNAPRDFNLAYLGSSNRPQDSSALIRLARARNAPIVLNQNGVAYPGWHGEGWESANEPLAELLHAAHHVIYQSAFCKLSADRFLGEPLAPWEILHNPVDTERFSPADRSPRSLTILLGGNQYQRYRFERGLRAFELISEAEPDARLLVTGQISWHPDRRFAEREARRLLASSPASARIKLIGPFTQREAAMLYRRGDVLLHPKYNDPCPTVVLEAMASGLPVVYSESGGTPELVGDAGIGVDAPLDWERDHPPDPEALAAAVLRVAAKLDEYSGAARARAVERFDLRPWLERHRALFADLVE